MKGVGLALFHAGRTDQDAVQGSFSVGSSDLEPFRHDVTGFQQSRDVRPDHLAEETAVPVTQDSHRSLIHPGPGICQAVGEDAHHVFAVLRGEQAESGAVKVHTAKPMIVGVGVFGQVVCHEVDLLPLRVHCHQLLHNDPLRGDGAFTAAISIIVPVQPGQTIPFRLPEAPLPVPR